MFYYLTMIVFIAIAAVVSFLTALVIILLFRRGFNLRVVWFLIVEVCFAAFAVSLLTTELASVTLMIASFLLGIWIAPLRELSENFTIVSNSKTDNWSYSSSDGSSWGDSCGGDGGGDGGSCD